VSDVGAKVKNWKTLIKNGPEIGGAYNDNKVFNTSDKSEKAK
jgi:hypothetical protein